VQLFNIFFQTSSKTIQLLNTDLSVKQRRGITNAAASHPVVTIPNDGVYFLFVTLSNTKGETFIVHIEMQGIHGYLSAADWPLLPVSILYIMTWEK
jgi:hypothetical protein